MPQTCGSLDHLYMTSLKTAFGWMRPISDGNSLIRLDWNQMGWRELDRSDHVSRETKSQLRAFFKGRLFEFTLPLAPSGISAAGQHWLDTMAKIPYGTIVTYIEFAGLAGKPNAARAAGASCAKNPIPIIYPCHRVIRKNGSLGNYGGGNDCHPAHADNVTRKADLLRHELHQIDRITT